MTHASLTRSSDLHMFSQICCFCSQPVPLLYLVPSVACGEVGIDELHVVGYVYQELLVCTANFTYIYAMSLSTLYSLCLLYAQIQHRKYLYQGVMLVTYLMQYGVQYIIAPVISDGKSKRGISSFKHEKGQSIDLIFFLRFVLFSCGG